MAACPAVALALGSGCGLSVAGPLDFDPLGAETAPPREGSVLDGEELDGGPDGNCPLTCSADGGQVVDCKGAVVTTCDAGSACGATAACVAVPWTPARLPGVTLWLRADKGLAADAGTAVEVWEDQSGKGHDAKQALLAAARPVVDSFSNGMPAVDFAGNRWLENATTSLVAPKSAYAVLTVGQAPATSAGPVFAIRRSAYYSASLFSTASPALAGKMIVHSDSLDNTFIADITPTVVVPFQSVHAYLGGTSPLEIYVNGVNRPLEIPSYGQVTETGLLGFDVGVCVPNTTNAAYNQYWNGKIAELVVVDGALLAADRAEWDAYAKARYALP